MLASLYNIPTDPRSTSEFSFANADHHTQIYDAIFKANGAILPVYLIDPMPMNALGVWLYNHQAMHNAQNSILGINGNDFTSLNFQDKAELSSWIDQHAQEHYVAAQKLGI